MGWVAIPENLSDDPKILKLSLAARWALIRAYCFSSRHETDGLIATEAADDVLGQHGDPLVAAGLVEPTPGGLRLIGFSEVNLTHEQREARRESTKNRVKAWREKQNTPCNDVTNGVSNAADRDRDLDLHKTETKTKERMSPTGAAAASPPRSNAATTPRSKRSVREPHPLRQEYLKDFHEAYKTASGGRIYTWTGRERAQLDQAASEIPQDTWRTACVSLASKRPVWLFRDGSIPGLSAFRRNLNDFAATASAAPAPVKLVPTDFMRLGAEMERDGFFQVRNGTPHAQRLPPREPSAGG